MDIRNRIEALRELMKDNGIDAYLVPSDDDHASEYVNDHFKSREWITGFNGSAGTALITADAAYLWTDGRYFLQAEDQLRGTGVELMKMNEPGVPTIKEKICELAAAHAEAPVSETACDDASKPSRTFRLGFDGNTMTASEGEKYEAECPVEIICGKDLIGMIWKDRPALEPSEIWEFPLDSCGRTFEEKLEDVRFEMTVKGADVLLVSDLMEVAWLFNLRGGDVLYTPVFYSYAIVTADKCCLFTLPGAVPEKLEEKLESLGVTLIDYHDTIGTLQLLAGNGETVWADKSKTSYLLLKETSDIINEPTPIEMMKAKKNDTEISATEHAHLKDGVAVTKFIYWLKQKTAEIAEYGKPSPEVPGVRDDGKLTEISACDKLESLRRAQDGCFDLSFTTIAGYMSNGAIIHYEPTPESDTEIKADGVMLVDSGGQYIDGTTDITRTIAVGPLTDKIKKYYTLVLKGHIDLAMSRFPRGTTGKDLDEVARKPILDAGLDYNHGTGHGVGHVLSVHEGPNYISKRDGSKEMIPGMITSDEPGLYTEGEFGIRIESEILCVRAADQPGAVYQDIAGKDAASGAGCPDESEMLAFKDITLAPFERDAIITEMLTEKELQWLNWYHERVYSSVSPFLTTEEAEWLRKVTQPM
ncbi:MAG: aminopeptidase P family protein [Eubacterium sp.]|nr:aminopeptidase P family protein [Eubacterium sp.]